MGRKTENTGFACMNCGRDVAPIQKGSIRNHCPFCLCSLHVDEAIGDRQSDCRGVMTPVDVVSHSQKGWQLVHQCLLCGFKRKNMVADDDDIDMVAQVMRNKTK